MVMWIVASSAEREKSFGIGHFSDHAFQIRKSEKP